MVHASGEVFVGDFVQGANHGDVVRDHLLIKVKHKGKWETMEWYYPQTHPSVCLSVYVSPHLSIHSHCFFAPSLAPSFSLFFVHYFLDSLSLPPPLILLSLSCSVMAVVLWCMKIARSMRVTG